MIIGFQEEEAQNTLWRDGLWRGGDYFMERMVSERDNFMLWATAIKCRIETCCRFARHLHSNRPFVHTKMDLNNYMLHLILSISNQNHPFYHSESLRWFPQHPVPPILRLFWDCNFGGARMISRISGRKKNLDVLNWGQYRFSRFRHALPCTLEKNSFCYFTEPVVRICQSDISDSTREVELREVDLYHGPWILWL